MVAEINTKEIFKQIKKQNGEKFAQVIRGDRHHDGGLCDVPDILHILEFAGNNENDAKLLYPVIKEIYKHTEKSKYNSDKDPLELLDEAGYDAFVVKTERQKNSIRKYFLSNEELCTFRDPDRHKRYYMIHAVKRGADKIKPSRHPEREDEYGTSVISIQIAKTGGFISIKNRYNHTVNEPDSTFNNNPDNIIHGLSDSLKNYFKVDFTTTDNLLPGNFRIIGNQFVHFNYEIDNVYYDAMYYAKDSEITKLNPDYEIMLDSVILNKQTGDVRSVHTGTEDLSRILNDEISGYKTKTETDKTTGETVIKIIDENKNIKELVRTKNGCITSLHLYKTSEFGDAFFLSNRVLETLYAPKLKKIGERCFLHNEKLKKLYVPELEEIGKRCFVWGDNETLTELNAPKLKRIGEDCFSCFYNLNKFYIPELEEIDDNVFENAMNVQEFVAPKLKKMGFGCFSNTGSRILKRLYVPELEKMGEACFNVEFIQNLYAPKLKIEERTPTCVKRAAKLAKIKNGIKNALRLFGYGSNKNDIQKIQSLQKEL